MDEFTKLINKLDFDKFFDLQLTRYAGLVEESRKEGSCNFNHLIATKQIFKDNLFAWFIKMIKQPTTVITPEDLIDVTKVRVFIQHSRENKTEHTMVPNDMLERILNVISKPSSEQNNTCAKVSPSGKS